MQHGFVESKPEPEPDWTGYDQAIAKGTARQLARARYGMTPDAFDQLEEAFIFHWRYALRVLKWDLWGLVTLRCLACGNRHWRPDLYGENGSRGGCYYGYGYTLTHGWRTWWYAGKHGDD